MAIKIEINKFTLKGVEKSKQKLKQEIQKAADKGVKKIRKEKRAKVSAYRREISLLATKARKRIEVLERNNLQDSPAYQRYLKEGAQPFGIKGKDYNEVQQEAARIRRFLESETSTFKGIRNVLTDMAKNTGIKYKNFSELKEKSKQFFDLAGKVEQYLRATQNAASAFGYNQIWEAINQYTEQEESDLDSSEFDLEEATEKIGKALLLIEKPITVTVNNEWFRLENDDSL